MVEKELSHIQLCWPFPPLAISPSWIYASIIRQNAPIFSYYGHYRPACGHSPTYGGFSFSFSLFPLHIGPTSPIDSLIVFLHMKILYRSNRLEFTLFCL